MREILRANRSVAQRGSSDTSDANGNENWVGRSTPQPHLAS